MKHEPKKVRGEPKESKGGRWLDKLIHHPGVFIAVAMLWAKGLAELEAAWQRTVINRLPAG